ncbi:hypothetical protein ACFL35_12995 [Candidatus Riflebacteria bacterium]
MSENNLRSSVLRIKEDEIQLTTWGRISVYIILFFLAFLTYLSVTGFVQTQKIQTTISSNTLQRLNHLERRMNKIERLTSLQMIKMQNSIEQMEKIVNKLDTQ